MHMDADMKQHQHVFVSVCDRDSDYKQSEGQREFFAVQQAQHYETQIPSGTHIRCHNVLHT